MRAPDSDHQLDFNLKTFSDMVEALIGAVFLNTSTLQAVFDFLNENLCLFDIKPDRAVENYILKDEKLREYFSNIFWTGHGWFLDWLTYLHPSQFKKMGKFQAPFQRMLQDAKSLQSLSSKTQASSQFIWLVICLGIFRNCSSSNSKSLFLRNLDSNP